MVRWVAFLLLAMMVPVSADAAKIREIRIARQMDFSRCVVELDSQPVFRTYDRSDQAGAIMIELSGVTDAPKSVDVSGEQVFVKGWNVDFSPSRSTFRLELRTNGAARLETMTLQKPWRLVLDVYSRSGISPSSASGPRSATPSATPAPTASYSAPVLAAAPGGFRPRVVVIDPGHGGHHRGGSGYVRGRKVEEAEVTLPIGLKLEKLIAADPMLRPRITRRNDVYVGLRERTKLAEDFNGNLFVSIHYNAVPPGSRSNTARGLEFWVWSPREGDRAADKYLLTLDNEEGGDSAVGDASRAARQMLGQMMIDALQEQAVESKQFAAALEDSFTSDRYWKANYRGVKESRFKVLENYNMPSVLIEVGFISHPDEARMATEAAFQDKVARSIYNGIVQYYMQNDPAFRAARSARK